MQSVLRSEPNREPSQVAPYEAARERSRLEPLLYGFDAAPVPLAGSAACRFSGSS